MRMSNPADNEPRATRHLPLLIVQLLETPGDRVMPPLPVGRIAGVSLARSRCDEGRVLWPSELHPPSVMPPRAGNAPRPRGVRTRSNAAIFFRLTGVSSALASSFSGTGFATSSVAGESWRGALSVHVVRSFAFWEVGVKKLATALSVGWVSLMQAGHRGEFRTRDSRLRFALERGRRDGALCVCGWPLCPRGQWGWAFGGRHLVEGSVLRFTEVPWVLDDGRFFGSRLENFCRSSMWLGCRRVGQGGERRVEERKHVTHSRPPNGLRAAWRAT